MLLVILPLGLVAAGVAAWLAHRIPTPAPDKAVLFGLVADAVTLEGIGGINVLLEGTSYAAVTASNGHYTINNIEPGSYTVSFTDPQGRYQMEVV